MARGCHHILWRRLLWSAGSHIWHECFFPCVLCIPIAFGWSYLLYYEHINRWDRSTWTFLATPVAFLLTGKMTVSYNRWWEGRNHLGRAKASCQSVMILLRPRILQGHSAAYECANDVRRYSMLYYWLLCFQLLGMEPDQGVVMHHLQGRPGEFGELMGRKENRALTALAWLSSRFSDMAEANVITQKEMQEALARVDEMTQAFNGATKIKSTRIPETYEHCCAVLTYVYVYCAPIALASDFIGQNDPTGTIAMAQSPRLGFEEVALRTMFASFWLGLAIFGIFEMGNCFTDPFGDDPADLGHLLVKAGNGLEADLRSMLEATVPVSRLRRESGGHIFAGRRSQLSSRGKRSSAMSEGKLRDPTEGLDVAPKDKASRLKARKAEMMAADDWFERRGTKEGPGRWVSHRSRASQQQADVSTADAPRSSVVLVTACATANHATSHIERGSA